MKQWITTGVLVLLMASVGTVFGQETWTLQQCIDYALENNIQIRQQDLTVNYQQNLLSQAKNDRFPNLNGQVGNNYNFGRSLTYENLYENSNSTSLSGYLGTDVTLWNGFQLQNIIRQRDLDLQASIEDLKKAKDDLILNLAALYLEILFAEELVAIDESQIDVTRQQIERTQKLVEAGSLAKGALLEVEAQLAREELQLVNDRNRVQLAYLNIFQLLELPLSRSFKIAKPELPDLHTGTLNFNSLTIFNNAVLTRPEIRAAQLRVESAQRQLDQAKGARWPKLSFGANYYNNYNDNYMRIAENNPLKKEVIPFSDQMKNNQRYGFGFTMNIPLFNKFQVQNAIANSELQIADYKYRLQNSQNLLQKEIEQAYTNALAALNKYLSGEKAVSSSAEAFRYAEEKYSVGLVTTVEYNQIKNNLTMAQSQLAQARYDYIFRTKILDFYNGIPIRL
ncbi:MAG: TolC family protein [Bacteroidota bacterium]|nr:TolC family protein [Bacteroidota bacterium]HNU77052.1 TolC family protein [Prolixibacteraceae bacterium]HPV17594.1 TolC family protein [Prolixibacteraceae bacterium]